MFRKMAVNISEDWIRERVQLKHDNLEDVRSLSLPGTYHEKIEGLGTALRRFSRLKHLDLSRNAINSLEGIEPLKLLEKLNLYYNNVPSLQELYRLRFNQKLQEVDLRLNPVARNEPDYRLFLIHMLPNLRRLDDRAVRDSERKAAIMHFSSEQAALLTEHPNKVPESTEVKQTQPRIDHVKSLAKPAHALDDEDVAVLDLISKTADNLGQNQITGSNVKNPDVQDYPSASLRKMDLEGVGLRPTDNAAFTVPKPLEIQTTHSMAKGTTKAGIPLSQLQDLQLSPLTQQLLASKYPNLPLIKTTPPSPGYRDSDQGTAASGSISTQQRAESKGTVSKPGSSQSYKDEIDAYTSYKAQGHFTPNPSAEAIEVENKTQPSTYKPPMPSYATYSGPQAQQEYHNQPSSHSPVPRSASPSRAAHGYPEHSAELRSQSPHRHPYTSYPYQYPNGQQPEYPAPPIPAPSGSLGPVDYQPLHKPYHHQQEDTLTNSYTSSDRTEQHRAAELYSPVPPRNYQAPPTHRGTHLNEHEKSYGAHSVPNGSPTNGYDSYHDQAFPRSVADTSLGEYSDIIEKISDLVDRYWNGSKSLVGNLKFRGLVTNLLKDVSKGLAGNVVDAAGLSVLERKLARLEEELVHAREENKELKKKVSTSTENLHHDLVNGDEPRMKLVRAQRDVSILRGRLQRSIEENKYLEEKLADIDSKQKRRPEDAANYEHIGRLQRENDQLRRDIGTLASRFHSSNQESDYANMLHQSHRTLAENNEHLTMERRTRPHDFDYKNYGSSYDVTINGS